MFNKKYAIVLLFMAVSIITLAYAQSTPLTPPYLSNYCNSNTATGPQGTIAIFANWYCNSINHLVYEQWSSDFPIALIAANIAFLVAVVIFMFGVSLKNDRLRLFGIGEIYEALASFLIVIMFMFIAAVLFGLLPGIVSGSINPYTTSLTYISSTIGTSTTMLYSLFTIAAVERYYSTITIQVYSGPSSPETIMNLVAAAIVNNFFWPAWTVITFLIEALVSLYTQFYGILFLMYAAIPVFLAPGVIFRSLLPTRHLGGMLIAIAIGFYFVMPTLFSVAYFYTSSSIQAQMSQAQMQLNQYGSGTSMPTSMSPSSPLVTTVKNLSNSFNAYWLSILFFPAVVVAITYSFITQIAELIGGMARPSSRLRTLV